MASPPLLTPTIVDLGGWLHTLVFLTNVHFYLPNTGNCWNRNSAAKEQSPFAFKESTVADALKMFLKMAHIFYVLRDLKH
jgi:hypothetical protein